MICRLWHGWTSPANADAYEHLLKSEIFHWIEGQNIAGYRGIELLRRPDGEFVAFITMMWFDSIDAIRAFAGPDYETAVVLPAAEALLERFDTRSAHYDVRHPRDPARRGESHGHH